MKDFKSYSPKDDNPERTQSKNGAQSENKQTDENVERTVNMATMLAKAFSGKSEKEIWQAILTQAEQGKRDGTLTNADLDNFYNALAPLVDGFKKQKLKSVIAKLKAI